MGWEVTMQTRHPDGRYRGRQPIEITKRSLRARWVKEEAQALRNRGFEYQAIADHITQVGRGAKSPVVPLPNDLDEAFPEEYSISAVACWKACNRGRKRRMMTSRQFDRQRLELYTLRKLYFELESKCKMGDLRALRAVLTIHERQARIMGYWPDGRRKQPEVADDSSLDLDSYLSLWCLSDEQAQALERRMGKKHSKVPPREAARERWLTNALKYARRK